MGLQALGQAAARDSRRWGQRAALSLGYSPGPWCCWQGLVSPEGGLPWAGQDKKTERDKSRVSRLGKEGGTLVGPWGAASKVSGWGLGSGKVSTFPYQGPLTSPPLHPRQHVSITPSRSVSTPETA